MFEKVGAKAFERSEKKHTFEKNKAKKPINRDDAPPNRVSFGSEPRRFYEKKPYIPPHEKKQYSSPQMKEPYVRSYRKKNVCSSS